MNNIPDDDINIIHPIKLSLGSINIINYANLDYKCIIPLIKKYFSPSGQNK